MAFGRYGGGSSGGSGGGSGGPKPVAVGDEVEVTIEAMAAKGDGIAKIDGFVVFVRSAQQGQKYKVKITEVRNRFAIGEIQ